MTQYEQLAEHLAQRSVDICTDNNCTEDHHNCDSYAYLSITVANTIIGTMIDVMLLDICLPDYFQGSSNQYIMLPLPWQGTAKDLKNDIEKEVNNQLF